MKEFLLGAAMTAVGVMCAVALAVGAWPKIRKMLDPTGDFFG